MSKKRKIVPKHILEDDGFMYMTLDGADADGDVEQRKQHTAFIGLPSGWTIARPESRVIDVVKSHTWSTCVLILSDGHAYRSIQYGPQAGSKFDDSPWLDRKGDSYKPSEQRARILLERPLDNADGVGVDLWADRKFPDFSVTCAGEKFECHRGVLAVGSPVFDRMFNVGMAEGKSCSCNIEDADPRVVEALLAFMYTRKLNGGSIDYVALVGLADRYQVEALVALAASEAIAQLSSENAFALARALRHLATQPAVKPIWDKLIKALQNDAELLSAALVSM